MTSIFRLRSPARGKDHSAALDSARPALAPTGQAGAISRRFILAGGSALASSAVLAAPIAATEDPATRVARLAEELSIALDSYAGGQFRAIVEPDSNSRCPVLFRNMRLRDPHARLNGAMGAVRDTLAEIYGCAPADHSYIGERNGVVVIGATPHPMDRVVWHIDDGAPLNPGPRFDEWQARRAALAPIAGQGGAS